MDKSKSKMGLQYQINILSPHLKYFTDSSKAVLLFWIIYVFCLVFLCLCARLWSPAGNGLTYWLSFVVSKCEFVTFPLVSLSGVVLDCIDS